MNQPEFQDKMLSRYVIVPNMPLSSSFVAIWQYNGTTFAHSFKWANERLYVYDEPNQQFTLCDIPDPFSKENTDDLDNLMFIQDISADMRDMFH